MRVELSADANGTAALLMNPLERGARVPRTLEEVHYLNVLGERNHEISVNVHDTLRVHLEARPLASVRGDGTDALGERHVVDVSAVGRGLHEGSLEHLFLHRFVG